MIVESSRVLMMEENLYPPQCLPIVYMRLVSFGKIQCQLVLLAEKCMCFVFSLD